MRNVCEKTSIMPCVADARASAFGASPPSVLLLHQTTHDSLVNSERVVSSINTRCRQRTRPHRPPSSSP